MICVGVCTSSEERYEIIVLTRSRLFYRYRFVVCSDSRWNRFVILENHQELTDFGAYEIQKYKRTGEHVVASEYPTKFRFLCERVTVDLADSAFNANPMVTFRNKLGSKMK